MGRDVTGPKNDVFHSWKMTFLEALNNRLHPHFAAGVAWGGTVLLCRCGGCRHRATMPANVVKCRCRGKFLIFRAAGVANYDGSIRMWV